MAVSASLLGACGAQVLDVGSDGKIQGAGPAQNADPSKTSDGANASPTSACIEVGATPKMLAVPAKGNEVRILVPDGQTLWLDGYQSVESAGPTQAMIGHLASVPVAGGAPTQLELDRYRSIAGIFGGKLVYVRTTHQGSSSKEDPRVEEIVVRDRTTGAEEVLKNPRSTTFVGSVVVHPTGVYWLAREYSVAPQFIVRWNGATVTELTSLENHSTLLTDGKDVFYSRYVQTNGITDAIRIEGVPITGGAPRVLRSRPYDKTLFYQVAAVDADEVYFTQESTTNNGTIGAGDLRAMKKDGSGERVLVSNERFSPASFRIDPDFASWTDQAAQQNIVRVRRSGGALERIEGLQGRWVSALAVDRCNIYWAIDNPAQVYARSRLP